MHATDSQSGDQKTAVPVFIPTIHKLTHWQQIQPNIMTSMVNSIKKFA